MTEDKYTGKRLDGRYEIHELIGSGGMSYVYKAHDRQYDRWVAIKILKEEFSDNSDFLRRFRNESRAIAMLSHDNIVKVFDVSFGDRVQYIVMEYIQGITLKDYITRKGALPWKDTVFFTMQILMALEHAHQNGIIHRDIKPQNIMLLKNGKIKVADFGIARFSQSETQTMTDKALGSVHYIAPEQAKGEYTSDKVDIYSLGVMMYEMLTGRLPFEADSAVSVAIMQLQAKAQKPRLINPDIPIALEEITLKAMEKNPTMRFRSAREMLEDFEKFRKNPDKPFEYENSETIDSTKSVDLFEEYTPNKKQENYHDNYEYEEELVKSKKHATGSMIITGIIAAFVLVVVVIGGYMLYQTLTAPVIEVEDEVSVPDFRDLNYYTDVENNPIYDDFEFSPLFINDKSKVPGTITNQEPEPDMTVKIGREIILHVVQEPTQADTSEVPDVVGDSQADAYNAIQSAGFTPRTEPINSNTAANYVVRTEPEAGSELEEGAEVVIYVSKGPATTQTIIPTLKGETLDYAVQLLEQSNLVVGEIEYDQDSKEPRDIVVDVSPQEGASVDEKTKVNITVSAGAHVEKTVPINFSLPSSVNADIVLKIYIDGALVHSAVVNPSISGSFSTQYIGKSGQMSVVVKLNDQDYVYGTLDFDSLNGSFTVDRTLTFNYTAPTT